MSDTKILQPDDSDDDNVRVAQETFFFAASKRGFTRQILAERSGISTDTLGIYCGTRERKASIMSLAKVRRLVAVVPLEVGSILLDGTGVHLVADDPRRAGWLSIADRMASFAAKVCRYQATGPGIDHREEADLREDIITIIAEGEGQVRR